MPPSRGWQFYRLVSGYRLGYPWAMKWVPLSEAKDRLSALVDEADRTHEIVQITRHGRPAAVLMSADDLESLHETVAWLSQPGIRDDVEAGRGELGDGTTVGGAELRVQIGLPPL